MAGIGPRAAPFVALALATFNPVAMGQAPGAPAPAASPAPAAPATKGGDDAAAGGVMEVDESGADERAKAHFRVGRSLYDSGRFAEAAAEWQQAYEMSKRPELLYNIYVAHRDANDVAAATVALRGYLEQAEIEPARRVNLEARLRALEQAAVAREAEPRPEPEPEVAQSAPEPEPEPQPAMTASADESDAVDVAPYVLMGLGGAMVVGGVVTGLMTQSKVDEVEEGCPAESCPAGFGLEGRRDDVESLALITDVLIFGGVAMAGVGAVLLLTGGDDERATTANLGCARDGCMATVRTAF